MAGKNEENRWQKYYRNTLYGGRMPGSKTGKTEYELLGNVRKTVTVHFPERVLPTGKTEPERDEKYTVTLDDCNMPEGRISVEVLSANLTLWTLRGYGITY